MTTQENEDDQETKEKLWQLREEEGKRENRRRGNGRG